jgi:acyl dehydratase
VSLNREFIGRSFAPSAPYEVSRVKIREFAYAIGDHNPAGDVLVGTPTIVDIRDAGRNQALTWEAVITTTEGEHVCTATNTLIERGA